MHISEVDRTLVRQRVKSINEEKRGDKEEDYDEKSYLDKHYLKNVNIADVFKEGDEFLVQVSKEPVKAKGAKLTTCFSIPGRFIILMPNIPKIGISKKIIDFEERKRLKAIMAELLPDDVGCIIRTTSAYKSESDIKADVEYLLHILKSILNKYKTAQVGDILYHDIDIVYQVIRDHLNDKINTIECDDKIIYEQLVNFIKYHCPEFVSKIKFYDNSDQSLFDYYNVEKQIQKSLHSKVELSNGVSIVLESTEAMTVVDVNTGRFIGNDNLDETLLKTNLEAAKEIVRQLKLRNIGGLIVIDFIDMTNYVHRNRLFSFFEKTLREEDHSQSVVLKISEFGLVQMTRKRTGKTPKEQLMENCCHCSGTGSVKSLIARSYELLRILERDIHEKKNFMVGAAYTCIITLHKSISDYLLLHEFEGMLYFKKKYNVAIVMNNSHEEHINAYHFEWVLSKGV